MVSRPSGSKSKRYGGDIRKSDTRVLVKVYADDTTVFLGPDDDPKKLQDCLDIFCLASTARFNNLKTEIIPLGSADSRREIIRTREFNNWKIDNEIHIAKEGEAVRILGSWQGNKVNIQDKWNEMMEKQLKTMKWWNFHYPSVMGRVLIVKALVISLAYYLMTVNGITRKCLLAMEKNIRHFIWNGRKGQIAWERAILPVKEGGIGAPSVRIRYKAIKVGWLKKWWTTGPDRPDWAWVANELMLQAAQKRPNIARPTVKEWICQSWLIKVQSDQMPNSLREVVKAAQKYNATISVMRAPMKLRLEMPAFHHPFARNKNLQNNSKAMRCLQDNHEAKTVGDLVQIVAENGLNPTNPCLYENLNGRKCKEKPRTHS